MVRTGPTPRSTQSQTLFQTEHWLWGLAVVLGTTSSACGPGAATHDDDAADDATADDDAADDDTTGGGDDDAADDDTAGDDDTTGDDDVGDDTTPADDDTVAPGAFARVDDGDGVVSGSADLALASDGTAWVSWVDTRTGERAVRVASSTDGGASFVASMPAGEVGAVPLVAMARKPYLATDGLRLATVFTTEDDPARVMVCTASLLSMAPVLTFVCTELGSDIPTTFQDFAKGAFSPGGELWVAWQAYDGEGFLVAARESQGFATAGASGGAPGLPCECCPLDLGFTAGGDALLAFRNNVDDVRDQYVARAPSGAAGFTTSTRASHTGWVVAMCPMQGPRMALTPGGDVLVAWSESPSGTYRAWLASSADDGLGFAGDHTVWEEGTGQTSPSIAAGGAGSVWIAFQRDGAGAVARSEDGGATFTAPAGVESPAGPLGDLELEAAGGRVALAGHAEDGSVWFTWLE